MLEIIAALLIVLGLSIFCIYLIDKLCFIIWYYSCSDGDIRLWDYNCLNNINRHFYIIKKGPYKTEIGSYYEHIVVPTFWIYRFSKLYRKNNL